MGLEYQLVFTMLASWVLPASISHPHPTLAPLFQPVEGSVSPHTLLGAWCPRERLQQVGLRRIMINMYGVPSILRHLVMSMREAKGHSFE